MTLTTETTAAALADFIRNALGLSAAASWPLARRVLFGMDAESAHDQVLALLERASRSDLALDALHVAFAPAPTVPRTVFGLTFPSPVGLAAGLDKNGVAIDAWAAMGFGFVEVGTVTPDDGQEGNDRPRIERLPADAALVNRMGFPNKGATPLRDRLRERRTHVPVGVNIGKAKETPSENAIDDYDTCMREVWDFADYLVANVSSPNTPGLRALQTAAALQPLLARLLLLNVHLAELYSERPKPVLVKVSPDLTDQEIDALADVLLLEGAYGVIATNTTTTRPRLQRAPLLSGGLSGRPLRSRSLEVTARLAARLGDRVPVISVGGIGTAHDVEARFRAGAQLVQVFTAFIYQGPSLLRRLAAAQLDPLHT